MKKFKIIKKFLIYFKNINYLNIKNKIFDMINNIFYENISPVTSIFVSLIISISFSFFMFPITYILGTGAFFETGDSAQHLSGWYFFKNDGWHFPLLKTLRFEPPQGINIAFTDSIPIAALFFKSIKFLLPEKFNYFGIWAVISILSQGLAATWILRILGEKRLIPIIVINFLFITFPSLTLRLLMQHTSLYTQSLTLFAFGTALLGLKEIRSKEWVDWVFRIILSISLLIHPYFLAMVSALYIGYHGELIFRTKKIKYTLLSIFLTYLIIFLLMWILGYFGNGDPQTNGFGFYSMNLSSLICGGEILLPSCSIDATGGQYEGDNYLGLGIVIVSILIFILKSQYVIEKIKRYPILVLTLCSLFIYSVAQKIFLGHLILLSLPFPHFFITSIFRSNGRFFWPVGQVYLFLIFMGFLRFKHEKKVLWLSLILLVVQLADLKGIILADRAFAQSQDSAFLHRIDKWSPLIQKVALVRVIPSFSCGGDPKQVQFFQYLSSINKNIFIGGYVAHGGMSENCSEMEKFKPRDKEIDIVLNKSRNNLSPLIISELKNDQCRQFSEGIACIKNSSSIWWQNNASWMKLPLGFTKN